MQTHTKSDEHLETMQKNVRLAPVMRKGFGYEMQLILRMDNMNAHVQATGVEDYIHKNEVIEKPGPELAQRLLDALDGVPLPEPSAQQVEMRKLFKELYNLSPATYARYPNWEMLALKAALNVTSGSFPQITVMRMLSVCEPMLLRSGKNGLQKPKRRKMRQAIGTCYGAGNTVCLLSDQHPLQSS